MPRPGWLATAGLVALLLRSPHARAGQGRDDCAGCVDSLPAQLDTPGT